MPQQGFERYGRLDLKLQRMIVLLLITGSLVLSAAAQEDSTKPTGTVAAQQESTAAGEHTIVVDVWSKATSPEVGAEKVSQSFAIAGLNTAFKMELTERKIENSLRRGFPLGEFWIQSDLAEIDDSLKLAALSVGNDADREALQELQKQSVQLRQWSDWLIAQNKNLALTEYYISSSTLDNDVRFQNNVACTNFLVSMLASRTLRQDSSCL